MHHSISIGNKTFVFGINRYTKTIVPPYMFKSDIIARKSHSKELSRELNQIMDEISSLAQAINKGDVRDQQWITEMINTDLLEAMNRHTPYMSLQEVDIALIAVAISERLTIELLKHLNDYHYSDEIHEKFVKHYFDDITIPERLKDNVMEDSEIDSGRGLR